MKMHARPLAVVAQRNSEADHRFPEWIAETLVSLGWQVEWLPAHLNRDQFDRALCSFRKIAKEPVFWSVNYRAKLSEWLVQEGLTGIVWNEVFPIAYKKIKALHHGEKLWFFCTSTKLLSHYSSLGVQTGFVPWGFNPSHFFPRAQGFEHDLSFVGGGLEQMEDRLSHCMTRVCDELDAGGHAPEHMQFLGSIAKFFEIFLGMQWSQLERYAGGLSGMIDNFCQALDGPKHVNEAVRDWLVERHGLFLGQCARLQRVASIRALCDLPSLAVYGRGWEGLELDPWLQSPVLYEDTAKVFRQSRISLHLHRLYMDGVNDRMINIPACGSLLLSRSTKELESILEPGRHFVDFQTVDEMRQQVDWLMKDECARARIAKAGQCHVHENFKMQDQVRKILRIVGLPDPSRELPPRTLIEPQGQKGSVFFKQRTIRMAVIGHGSMGRHHARVIDQLEGAELIAVSDEQSQALFGIERRYGCRTYTNYQELLLKETLDAVCVAVPTSSHQEVTQAAMLRGIHVLVEKPIASSIEASLELEALAARSQAKLMVGHIERFNPALRELKHRLDQGELGKIFHLEARRQGPYPARIMDVGVAVDLAVHDIDLIRFVTGQEVRRVYGHVQNRIQGPHEDALHGILHLTGNVVANLSVNWITPTKVRTLSVVGEAGMFVVDYISQDLTFHENRVSQRESWQPVALLRGVGEGQMTRYHIPKSEPLRNELEHFVQCIREGKEPITTANDGVRALTIAHSLLESSHLGASLDLEFSQTGSHLCVAA